LLAVLFCCPKHHIRMTEGSNISSGDSRNNVSLKALNRHHRLYQSSVCFFVTLSGLTDGASCHNI